MPEEAVVADSGPLIALALAGCYTFFATCYGKVLVPDAVWREVTEGGQGRAGAAEIASASWLERTKLDRRYPIDCFAPSWGRAKPRPSR